MHLWGKFNFFIVLGLSLFLFEGHLEAKKRKKKEESYDPWGGSSGSEFDSAWGTSEPETKPKKKKSKSKNNDSSNYGEDDDDYGSSSLLLTDPEPVQRKFHYGVRGSFHPRPGIWMGGIVHLGIPLPDLISIPNINDRLHFELGGTAYNAQLKFSDGSETSLLVAAPMAGLRSDFHISPKFRFHLLGSYLHYFPLNETTKTELAAIDKGRIHFGGGIQFKVSNSLWLRMDSGTASIISLGIQIEKGDFF